MVVVIEEEDSGTKLKTKKALEKLRRDFAEGKEISDELTKVWRKIKNDAITICPKDTGALASTIRIAKLPSGMMFGGRSVMKELTVFDRSIIAGDITKRNPRTRKPVNYAIFVHDGHVMRDGRRYSGIPFLSEAIAKNYVELENAIKRALKKLGKKFETSE